MSTVLDNAATLLLDPVPVSRARLFDVRLPDLALVKGGVVALHHARASWWGPSRDLAVLSANASLLEEQALTQNATVFTRGLALPHVRTPVGLDSSVPTVLVVHALTGDARAAGPLGFWSPLIGPGQVFDTDQVRVICVNNLGSNYGSSSPLDEGWPIGERTSERWGSGPTSVSLTTTDQARAIWQTLDAMGVGKLHLAVGGSLGGMIVQALAALRPNRVARIMPIAAAARSSSWVIGLNHVQRQAIALDPGFPHDISRGLEVARQIAMLTYRAEPGLALTQPRLVDEHQQADKRHDSQWSNSIASYLEHQGSKLRRRFDGRSYLAMLDAMDSHDLVTVAADDKSVDKFPSSLVVSIDTDVLFTNTVVDELAIALTKRGSQVARATLHSPHGHDAFLIEWQQMRPLCAQAMRLPVADDDVSAVHHHSKSEEAHDYHRL